MKQFRFQTSATDIYNHDKWDWMPEDAFAALQQAKAEIKRLLACISGDISNEEWEDRYRRLCRIIIQVDVSNENNLRAGDTEQVNTGEVTLTINM